MNKNLKTLILKDSLILRKKNHRKKTCPKVKENLHQQSHKLSPKRNPKQNLKENLTENPLLNQNKETQNQKVQKSNQTLKNKCKPWIRPLKIKHKKNNKDLKDLFLEKNHLNNQSWKINKSHKDKKNKSHKLKNN